MKRALIAFALVVSSPTVSFAADERELIELPRMMQDHMLANMRDHLDALDEILFALSKGDVSDAAKIAETRLGLSSLDDHGAKHLATFMPRQMQAFGTSMHQAASRFATAIETSDIAPSAQSRQDVFSALQEITRACSSCHAAYRIR